MTRGRWVLVAIVVVALGMSVATWPLLKVRREGELQRTETLIAQLSSACRDYKLDHGRCPERLSQLNPAKSAPVDAWGRPFLVESLGVQGAAIRSLGPDAANSEDDIVRLIP